MTPEERYLFDLHGYLVLRGVLSPDIRRRLNETIDHLETLDDSQTAALGTERKYRASDNVYAQTGAPSEGGLGDYDCEVLRYGGPFEELIDLPQTLLYIEEMISEPSRLDAASFMSRNSGGAFRFHHGYAELLPYSEYAFRDGAFKCVSVKIGYALTDVDVEDGCFAVIPGSHKSNFTIRSWDRFRIRPIHLCSLYRVRQVMPSSSPKTYPTGLWRTTAQRYGGHCFIPMHRRFTALGKAWQ